MEFLLVYRHNKPLTDDEERKLKKEIVELGEFTSGFDKNVYVVGGISIGLAEGKFYRNPHDIDIAVFNEDLEDFYDYFSSKGYVLVRKIGFTHVSPQYDLRIVSETEPDKVRKMYGNNLSLNILRGDKKSLQKINKRTDFLDLFLLEDRGNTIYLPRYDVIIPKEEFLPGKECPLENGTKLLIPNLEHRKRIEFGRERYLEYLSRTELASNVNITA